MEQLVQRVFLLEIKTQSELINLAFRQLKAAEAFLSDINEGLASSVEQIQELQREINDRMNGEWLALQTIAVSAANLSKLLWGSRGKRAEERRTLREQLVVKDDSPLKSPDLRNDFEHFDERIVERFKGDRPYVARNIGSLEDIHIEGEQPDSRFGHYDPKTGVLSFWANSIDIFEVAAEAARIAPLAEEAALSGEWSHAPASAERG